MERRPERDIELRADADLLGEKIHDAGARTNDGNGGTVVAAVAVVEHLDTDERRRLDDERNARRELELHASHELQRPAAAIAGGQHAARAGAVGRAEPEDVAEV